MTDAPERIWLQIGDPTWVNDQYPTDHEGVTWCWEPAWSNDIQYIRADSLPRAPEPDWSQAPEWAQWWAVDDKGKSGWYPESEKPFIAGPSWVMIQRRPEADE